MTRSPATRRWLAGALISALLLVATHGLQHARGDEHGDGGLNPDCAICRVVSSSAAVLSHHTPLVCRLACLELQLPDSCDSALDCFAKTSRSRGPPLLS